MTPSVANALAQKRIATLRFWLCNLHALDVARGYCDRLVGMSAGRVVFDGAPDALTEDLVHTLYGIEATEVSAGTAPQSSAVGVVLPFARHA